MMDREFRWAYDRVRFPFLAKMGLLTIVLTVVLGACPVEAAHPCSALLKKILIPEKVINDEDILRLQMNADLQFTTRDLGEYISSLQIGPLLHRGSQTADFHWLDVGGGAGVAALQSFIRENYDASGYRYAGEKYSSEVTALHQVTVVSYEDLYYKHLLHDDEEINNRRLRWRPKLMQIYERQTETGKYNYLTGRFFEDIPNEEIKPAHLITDLFGAFSYSKNKFQILKKMIEILAPGGTIMIWSQWPMIKIPHKDGTTTEVNLKQYLETASIPGVQSVSGPALKIQPTSETWSHLDKLEHRLKLVKVIRDMPPRFHYQAVFSEE